MVNANGSGYKHGLDCRIETARFREEHFHVLREPDVQWA